MNAPISSGDFDPLAPPGSNTSLASADGADGFRAGQFVTASMDNTAFFAKRPKGDADADKLLSRGTQMKVVSNDGSYLKVELDSGEVGYIPTVMAEEPSSVTLDSVGAPGEFQVYPPLPTGAADDSLPIIDPENLPPEGAIPTVIDPEGPAPLPPGIEETGEAGESEKSEAAAETEPAEPKTESEPAVEKEEE